jgi:hypothetical protein
MKPSKENRELEFDYYHTWSSGSISSISFGIPLGVGVSYEQETNTWDVERSFTADQIGNHKVFEP